MKISNMASQTQKQLNQIKKGLHRLAQSEKRITVRIVKQPADYKSIIKRLRQNTPRFVDGKWLAPK